MDLFENNELIIADITVILYVLIIIIEFLISRINAIKYCAASICNFLFIFLICQCIKSERQNKGNWNC